MERSSTFWSVIGTKQSHKQTDPKSKIKNLIKKKTAISETRRTWRIMEKDNNILRTQPLERKYYYIILLI